MSNTNLIESRKENKGKLQDFLQIRTLWEKGIAAGFPWNAFLSPSSSFHQPLKKTTLLLKACELSGNGHMYDVSHLRKQKQYRTLGDFISSVGTSNTTTRPVILLSGAAR